jgi:hypothetical protein
LQTQLLTPHREGTPGSQRTIAQKHFVALDPALYARWPAADLARYCLSSNPSLTTRSYRGVATNDMARPLTRRIGCRLFDARSRTQCDHLCSVCTCLAASADEEGLVVEVTGCEVDVVRTATCRYRHADALSMTEAERRGAPGSHRVGTGDALREAAATHATMSRSVRMPHRLLPPATTHTHATAVGFPARCGAASIEGSQRRLCMRCSGLRRVLAGEHARVRDLVKAILAPERPPIAECVGATSRGST